MKKYISLRMTRREIDALHLAIKSEVISDLKDFPDALYYWENGRSFFMDEHYFTNSFKNIDAVLTYPNIPTALAQELTHLKSFMRASLYGGMVQPADISELLGEMETYDIWRNRVKQG